MSLPLTGVRVIDLTRILAGPFATMQLADLGADVVKVERPGSGDETRQWGPPFQAGVATYFLAVNRGKRSVTLDLKADAGREVLWDLLAGADVVVSNFRPGVMQRIGFAAEELERRCPRLIDCRLNGYGEESEFAQLAAFDLVIQAESGLMELTGEPEGPPTKSGISIADEVAGLYVVQGVLAALIERSRTGRGRRVEVALFDAMLSLFTYQAQQYLSTGAEPRRMGNSHPSLVPYRPFDTADEPVVVGVASDDLWIRFCAAIARDDLAQQACYRRNASRVRHRVELEAVLAGHLKSRTAGEWIARLQREGVPCGRVRTLGDALDSRPARVRELIGRTDGAGMPYVRGPLRFGAAGPGSRTPPGLGEHTIEVLAELGYDATQLARLRELGAI